jgi:hypothetical protein
VPQTDATQPTPKPQLLSLFTNLMEEEEEEEEDLFLLLNNRIQ